MKTYQISISASDKKLNAAVKEVCNEQIKDEQLTHDGWWKWYKIEEHNDTSFADLMIQVGINRARLQG